MVAQPFVRSMLDNRLPSANFPSRFKRTSPTNLSKKDIHLNCLILVIFSVKLNTYKAKKIFEIWD